MLYPYFKISTENGKSGGTIRINKFPRFHVGRKHIVSVEWVLQCRPRFNPYVDLAYGGTTLGYRGKNYWIPKDTMIGRIIYLIFKSK